MNSSFIMGFLFGAGALYMYSDTVRRNVAITNRELDRMVVESLARRGIHLDEYGNIIR